MKHIWLYFVVSFRALVEKCRVAVKYYPKFLKIDLLLKKHYFFKSSFKVSKNFLLKRGVQNIYSYGETPLTTMEKIVNECEINPRDTVFDLGCGAGRSSFWLRQFVSCQVVGVDYVPEFINTANTIKERTYIDKISFINDDFCNLNYDNASIIYFYGTGFDDNTVQKLTDKICQSKQNPTVITVSYPLTDYNKNFQLIKTFSANYPWGVANIFLQKKRPKNI